MNSIRTPVLAAAAFLSLGGCVIVPYPVAETVQTSDDVELDERLVVTVGPMKMIQKISGRIENADKEIEVVDAIEFRDAAFPDGGWRLADLLDVDPTSERRVDGVRYLVVIGSEPMTQYGEDKGGYVPALVGLQYSSQTSRLTALIVDVETGQLIKSINVEADGTPVMVTWIVVSAIKHPMTGTAVLGGLSQVIVDEIRQHAGEGPLRVAVLAAEGSADPFGIEKEMVAGD